MAPTAGDTAGTSGRPAATVTIAAAVLRDFLERLFAAFGCSEENARIAAEGVVEADLRGHRIQGTDHIASIIRELKAGTLRGRARPRVARETPATARVDGEGAIGYVAGRFATDVAIRKARESGAAVVGLVRGGDLFMLGAYVERMARAGLAGMTFTNGTFRVHPPGGIDPVIGTNPVAFGFPVPGRDPAVIDFAISTAAMGHVRIASYGDEPIPAGVALDRDGRPTTDAKAALEGAFTAIGGHKGFALGLAGALLSGPIIGAMVGRERAEAAAASKEPPERGHTFVAIDPAGFGDVETSLRRTRRFVDEIKASRRAPGVDEILIPGERSFRSRRRALDKGVELLRTSWRQALALAEEAGVEAPPVAAPGGG